MYENRVKRLWSEGKPAINAWLSIGNAFSAEIMAAQGYDSITVDLQHGIVDYSAAVAMFQGARASAATPMARVPWLDPAAIMQVLDAGALGVICPMISTRAQAEEFVSYVRYPPRGVRSFGPTRAALSAGPDYDKRADDIILCFAMIETREALENVDAIVSTPGLDAVYIGPADLTLALTGRTYPTGLDRAEPEMVDAIKHILTASRDAGIRAGIHCGTPEYAAQAASWGFDLVTAATDFRILAASARNAVERTRRLIAGQKA